MLPGPFRPFTPGNYKLFLDKITDKYYKIKLETVSPLGEG
jgi:hypothetical protein